MWVAQCVVFAAAIAFCHALAQPLPQPLPQPQQYPPPPYGQPGAPGQPGSGSYPPPGGYGGIGGYNATPYGGAGGIPGYPGGNDLFRPVYEWFKIDFAWPDENLKQSAMRASQYIPENNALAGIKVWRDRMFLSVPRWKEGVPATLTSVPAQPRGGSNAPRLEPFPSWEWQEQGNCSALQNVHGFEIDSEGRMWVVDAGRVNTKGRNQENRCPPKLVIFDLNTAQFTDNYYNNGYNMNPGSSGYPGPGSVFNDPNSPYNPNRPYDPNRPLDPSRPYDANRPYDPNRPYDRPYSSNPSDPNYRPPYSSNPSDPNSRSPYSSNPSDPNYRAPLYSSNPSDPNYRPYSSNPGDPNYRDPNYRSGYDHDYRSNDPYHHSSNQFGGSSGGVGGYGSNNPLYRHSPGSRIRVIKSYTFPDEAAQRTSSMLTNIVLDSNDGWYAYITDSSDADPGIIVFSLAQSRSWKVRDSRSMRADPRTDAITINGDRAEIQVNVQGIALSPSGRERMIYYSPLSSTRLYSLPTTVLREPGRDIAGSVNDLGMKLGISDGMIMDSNGVLYFGNLNENGVGRWDSHRDPFSSGQRIMARDRVLLQWPDTFAIDQAGNLLAVTNRLQNFLRNRPADHEPTYRVVRAALGVQSYLNGAGTGTFGGAYRPNPGITGTYGAEYGAGYDPFRQRYDDPNNNIYDPNYRQPSSFDTQYGAAGGAFGSSAYGGRGYYGRYNAASATSAPMTLLATLLAAVLALGVLAERR